MNDEGLYQRGNIDAYEMEPRVPSLEEDSEDSKLSEKREQENDEVDVKAISIDLPENTS